MTNSELLFCYLLSIFLFFQLIPVNSVIAQQTDISGRELFIEYRCARCHTIGRGRFVGPDLINLKNKYSEQEIARWIMDPTVIYNDKGKKPLNKGYPPMPPLNVPENHAYKITEYLLGYEFKDQQDEKGTIAGNVFNYSRDRERVDGVEVILISYMGDREMERQEAVTNSSGEFTFDDLVWNRSYGISVNYKKAEYTTDKMVFPPDETIIELDLPVYEPTDNTDNISIQQHHIIIDVREDVLYAAEIIDLKNTGNRIYTGKNNDGLNLKGQTMVIDLAKNATNIDLVKGLSRNNLILKDNRIHDKTAIAPGYRRIILTYQIPFDKGDLDFDKNLYFRTENMLVLISSTDIKTYVLGLEEGEEVEFHDQKYSRWQGGGFESGDSIKIRISRPFLHDIISAKLIPILVFLLLLLSAIMYNLFYKKKKTD